LIRQVHQVVVQGKVHQELPFEQLLDVLDVERDSSRHPLFQVMFSVQDFGGQSLFESVDTQGFYSPAKFDINLMLSAAPSQSSSQIEGNFNYATSLFTQASIERLAAMYQRVLRAFANPQTQLKNIDLLSNEERNKLLYHWHDNSVDYPQKTLVQLFEAQVQSTPQNIAIASDGQQLSYLQLNQWANQLAGKISKNNPQGKPVALHMTRSVEMIVAMMAVLKSGAAYVPVSPNYPDERVQFMLSDCDCDVVLKTIEPDSGQVCENPTPKQTIDDLAYVIYTSGTTGQPKGVLIPHRGVVSLLLQNTEMQLCADDVLLHLSDPNFDAATFEIWGALLHGATLAIAPVVPALDANDLALLLNQHQVSVLWLTKSLFDQLYMAQPDLFADLRCLLIGGEALTPGLIKQLMAQPQRPQRILNGYGPTESTTFTTLWQAQTFDGPVPLGKATNNRRLYVLNSQLEPVAVGCPGELYIGGDGLALGYLNQPKLTEQCFITSPFVNNERLYKSGDQVRWLADGTLQYLGRGDKQVKIRGFRIEPGEVENVLGQLPSISQAVVIVTTHNDEKVLLAYVVMQPEMDFDSEQLRINLSDKLPAYMLPTSFISIENIPLTANGKLDVKALPMAEFADVDAYVAPRNLVEQQLCDLWQDVLGLERVGIQDNFFRLGGNSISAMRLSASMNLPLVQLFEQPYIAQLAALLGDEDSLQIQIPHIEQSSYQLSFAQQRLWFIEQFEQGSNAYHIPYLVKLMDCDLTKLTAAINVVAERHQVLKSVYLNDVQTPLETPLTLVKHTDLKAAISQPFDLSSEPSLKLIHVCTNEGDDYLLMLFHHIAFDGWSLDIFNRELAQVLKGEGQGKTLPPLDISYGDYAQWQREYLTGEAKIRLLDYWQQQLSGCETLTLATDYSRPPRPDYHGADVAFTLDETISQQLHALAKNQQTTVYTVLLSGFYVALAALSGQTDIVIGTPSDNREHQQTQALIGFFVSSLVLRAQLEQSQSIKELIAQVHQVVVQGKVHQELPFEELLDALGIERDSSRHPLFQVMFSVQDFGGQNIAELPFEPVELGDLYSPAKFDLNLMLNDCSASALTSTSISGNLNYATKLFGQDSITRLIAMYQRILSAFVDSQQLNRPLGDIEVNCQQERALIEQWNDTQVDYPATNLFSDFCVNAKTNPENIAVITPQSTVNYGELNDLRLALASNLLTKSEEGELIAVLAEKGALQVAAVLAVKSIRCSYLPLNVAWPAQRLFDVLQAGGVSKLLLTQRQFDQIKECDWLTDLEVLVLDEVKSIVEVPVLPTVLPDDIAYVIFTSGSTGKPKGVVISHEGAMNTVIAINREFSVTGQ
ncbi:MAG: amino acid adenylation domain-containing protein, partial [Psychrosphaera sp.]|nr:amino acid adenylation domain-containing protein [Psychrosphaera sp.]